MSDRQITAEWAWISKQRGAETGAGIVATSDSEKDFGRYLGPYATGSPSSTTGPGEPEAPPWVTFGPFRAPEDGTLVSVSARDQWTEVDHVGRPVWPRRLFLCRFADLAAADASYQTMWKAIDPVTLPTQSRQPVQLRVEPQSLEDVVATINRYGFDSLAALAAGVLQDRVAVADATALRLGERLAVIDAVAALLPYGFRADLSASSCVNNSANHGIRLVFADFPSGQQLLPLRGTGSELGPGVALDYLKMLRRKAKISGLGSIIVHLRDAKNEYTFDRPEDALEILGKLDLGQDFIAALRGRSLTREQILTFFREPKTTVEGIWINSDTSDHDYILRLLLGPDDQVAGILRLYWGILVDGVTRFALRRLDDGDPSPAEWLLNVASTVPREAEDDLLARLIIGGQVNLEHREERRDALLRLLRKRPAPPAPDRFRVTCDVLREARDGTGRERLVLQLLISEISSKSDRAPSRAVSWAEWLCWASFADRREGRAWPDWVPVLECALSGFGGQAATGTVTSLIRRTPGWAVVLGLARQTGHLGEILDAISLDLVDIAVQLAPPDAAAAALAEALSFDSSGLAPETIAVVDAVRVLLGRAPVDLLTYAGQATFGRYDQSLKVVFSLPAVQAAASLLERGFLGHAIRMDPAATLPDGAIRLMRSCAANADRAPGLARFIIEAEIADALSDCDQLDGAFWEELLKYEPKLKAYAQGPILRTAAQQTIKWPAAELPRIREHINVPATGLAGAMCEAYIAGLPVDRILGLLQSTSADGKNLTSIGPDELDKVLRQFQALLYYEDGGHLKGISVDVLFECYLLISNDALGPRFGRQFARRAKKTLRRQIRSRKKAIRMISRGARRRFLARWARTPEASHPRHGAPVGQAPYRGKAQDDSAV